MLTLSCSRLWLIVRGLLYCSGEVWSKIQGSLYLIVYIFFFCNFFLEMDVEEAHKQHLATFRNGLGTVSTRWWSSSPLKRTLSLFSSADVTHLRSYNCSLVIQKLARQGNAEIKCSSRLMQVIEVVLQWPPCRSACVSRQAAMLQARVISDSTVRVKSTTFYTDLYNCRLATGQLRHKITVVHTIPTL